MEAVKENRLPGISLKITPETQGKLFDEQKRMVVSGQVHRVSEASATRIAAKAVTWFLNQPESVRDEILASS